MRISENDPIDAGIEALPENNPINQVESRTNDAAFAVIHAGLAKEAVSSEKIRKLSNQVKEQWKAIDLLLDFNQELTLLPENKDEHELSYKMKEIIHILQENHNIKIWNSEEKISKEKRSELKAQIGSQVDKLRTAGQTTISTEIQPETNNIQAIMNIVQQIIQLVARLIRKTLELPR